jgi:putative transposase
MSKAKRHTGREIAVKLAHADILANHGTLQTEIARTLGVSVMTLHRWRKMTRVGLTSNEFGPAGEALSSERPDAELDHRIAELKLENRRLRTLLSDLLLDKMRLEEASKGPLREGNREDRP